MEEREQRFQNDFRRFLTERRNRLAQLEAVLKERSPRTILERGYSITRDAEGRIVRDAAQVAIGAEVIIHLARGELEAVVKNREYLDRPSYFFCRTANCTRTRRASAKRVSFPSASRKTMISERPSAFTCITTQRPASLVNPVFCTSMSQSGRPTRRLELIYSQNVSADVHVVLGVGGELPNQRILIGSADEFDQVDERSRRFRSSSHWD